MYSRIGMETVEIDVKKKYFKPVRFGNFKLIKLNITKRYL